MRRRELACTRLGPAFLLSQRRRSSRSSTRRLVRGRGFGCFDFAAPRHCMACELRGLTFELTPTAEAGGVSRDCDDSTTGAGPAYTACRSGSGVERGVRPRRQCAADCAAAQQRCLAGLKLAHCFSPRTWGLVRTAAHVACCRVCQARGAKRLAALEDAPADQLHQRCVGPWRAAPS